MRNITRAKRRLLTASAGAAIFTALEGLACGNPVEPRYRGEPTFDMERFSQLKHGPIVDAGVDASDASDSAPADAGSDAR